MKRTIVYKFVHRKISFIMKCTKYRPQWDDGCDDGKNIACNSVIKHQGEREQRPLIFPKIFYPCQ